MFNPEESERTEKNRKEKKVIYLFVILREAAEGSFF